MEDSQEKLKRLIREKQILDMTIADFERLLAMRARKNKPKPSNRRIIEMPRRHGRRLG